jgi:peroxiredoxin
MGNNLTGDYEAVMQVSIRQVNGLLATLHQNGENKDATPTFPHSLVVRVGEQNPGGKLGVLKFGEWVSAIKPEFSLAGAQAGAARVIAEFPALPPGAATLLKDEFSRWNDRVRLPTNPALTSGSALVQFSSPVISVAEGVAAELTSSVFIRVLYFPDPSSHELAEPIHGEVRVTYQPRPRTLASGERIFDVPFPTDDSKIRFFPEPGTINPAQAADIERQLRVTLRKGFKPMTVRLSGDLPFAEFKGVGSLPGGAGQALAIALPVSISSSDAPAGDIQSIPSEFLGLNDFAIAVSKEAIGGIMQSFINSINAAVAALSIDALGATYKARFSSGPSLEFQSGQIVFSGRVEIETSAALAPDGFISFDQALTLELNVPAQTVTLKALGDPNVDESWFIPHSLSLSIVRSQRDAGLVQAANPIRNILSATRNRLLQALQQFDASSSIQYTSTGITPDGLVISGSIDTKYHYKPVLQFTETSDKKSFTAFQSWIPGGRITNYHWSWVESIVFRTQDGIEFTIPWFANVKSIDTPHRFVLAKPEQVEIASQICLLAEGTQVNANGDVLPVSEGRACRNTSREPILSVPAGWEKLLLPKWAPNPNPESILSDGILGHIDVLAPTRNPARITSNTLVYFCDWRAADLPLQGLQRGLSLLRRRDANVSVIIVLPSGGLNMPRREFERRLGPLEQSESGAGVLPVRFDFADDALGGWARTFGTRAIPAAFLINARGEFVWKSEGEVQPEPFAAALEKHLVPTEGATASLLELALQPGQRAPELFVEDDRQTPVSLRKLMGLDVLLNFWQSWSNPCQLELKRLEELQGHAGDRPLRVIGLCGDSDPGQIQEFRDRNNLTVTLAHDADQRIARQYGVRFWPTTVSINVSGFIDGVQFGLATRQNLTK